MEESRIHGLHRIGEVLEALYPGLLEDLKVKYGKQGKEVFRL